MDSYGPTLREHVEVKASEPTMQEAGGRDRIAC